AAVSDAVDPAVSADGRYVAFSSAASNLTGGTTGYCLNHFGTIPQIIVRDTWSGTTTIASRASGADGAPSDGCALKPSISPDGRWVVFEAPADNLTPDSADNALRSQIYVRDMQTNTTTLVSRMTGADGAIADGDCNWASVSDDGRYVGFNSEAS